MRLLKRKWLPEVFKRVGILAFQGDVSEHIDITKQAAKNLHLSLDIIPVRTKESLKGLDALIIPGGESTTLYKLCEREGMWEEMKRIRNIFGTCAGAIMLAKLELMDIEVVRNAYGRQAQSFVKKIETKLGTIEAVFIRAPKIRNVGKTVNILAKDGEDVIACEEKTGNKFYLALCFHPELTTTKFHEYFLNLLN